MTGREVSFQGIPWQPSKANRCYNSITSILYRRDKLSACKLLPRFSNNPANMTSSTNLAAWQLAAKGDLDVREAPMYTVDEDEILIKVSSYISFKFRVVQ
jgi:hypothetical protein